MLDIDPHWFLIDPEAHRVTNIGVLGGIGVTLFASIGLH